MRRIVCIFVAGLMGVGVLFGAFVTLIDPVSGIACAMSCGVACGLAIAEWS